MTKRTCPWCGRKDGLYITNVMSDNKGGPGQPVWMSHSRLYWEDRECGYREVTWSDEWYDYNKGEHGSNPGVFPIISFHKPLPPLPVHQQPEYLRKGTVVPDIPQGQMTFEEKMPA